MEDILKELKNSLAEEIINEIKKYKTKDLFGMVLCKFNLEYLKATTNETSKYRVHDLSLELTTILKFIMNNKSDGNLEPLPQYIDSIYELIKNYEVLKNLNLMVNNKQMTLDKIGNEIQIKNNSEFFCLNNQIEFLNVINKANEKETFILKESCSNPKAEILQNNNLKLFELKNIPIKKVYLMYEYFLNTSIINIQRIIRGEQQFFELITVPRKSLIKDLEKYCELDNEQANKLFELFRFDYSNKKTESVLTTPILEFEENIYLLPFLYTTNNFNRNIEELLKVSKNKKYSEVKKNKEKLQLKRIEKNIECYNNLFIKTRTNLMRRENEILVDVDLAIYDEISKRMLICEVKDFLKPDKVIEHCSYMGIQNKLNENAEAKQIFKGYSQLNKIKNYCKEKTKEQLIKDIFKKSNLEIEEIEYIIIVKDYFPNITMDIDLNKSDNIVLDENLFKLIVDKHKGNLKNIINYLKKKEYIPIENLDFQVKTNKLKVNNKVINYEYFSFNDVMLENYNLRLKKS